MKYHMCEGFFKSCNILLAPSNIISRKMSSLQRATFNTLCKVTYRKENSESTSSMCQ